MTINPTLPYHTRSPDLIVRNVHEFNGMLYGELVHRDVKYMDVWRPMIWDKEGKTKDFIEDYALIQEPEVEEIVWEDIKLIHAYGYALDKRLPIYESLTFPKPITLRITIQGDKVKIETI
jgi:hypothetical protein